MSPSPADGGASDNGNGAPEPFSDKIKTLAGLLVAGFAGAINVIGLKSSELSSVLRNESHRPTWVLALIVAGILTAVASVFVAPRSRVSAWVCVAVIAALLAPVALSVVLIQIPGSTSKAQIWWGTIVAAAGGLVAVVLALALRRNAHPDRPRPLTTKVRAWKVSRDLAQTIRAHQTTRHLASRVRGWWRGMEIEGRVPVQGLLIFVSVALSATATYSALRLETVSQLSSTAAQLSVDINGNPPNAVIVSIDASKLRDVDRVNVSATALQSDIGIATFCHGVPPIGTLQCAEAPCFTLAHDMQGSSGTRNPTAPLPIPEGCENLSSGVYQPNADGSVQQTTTIPVSTRAYQRIELIGEVCVATASQTACSYDANTLTRVDIQLSPPPADRATAG